MFAYLGGFPNGMRPAVAGLARAAHQRPPSREDHQRHQREGDPERQHHLGLIATPSTISAGVMVTARRKNTGIRRRRKPCMTTWPAKVPTDEEEMPDASSAMPKISPLW
jgi:hypothetical protein